jgi:hypothetical protein
MTATDTSLTRLRQQCCAGSGPYMTHYPFFRILPERFAETISTVTRFRLNDKTEQLYRLCFKACL